MLYSEKKFISNCLSFIVNVRSHGDAAVVVRLFYHCFRNLKIMAWSSKIYKEQMR